MIKVYNNLIQNAERKVESPCSEEDVSNNGAYLKLKDIE